MKHSCYFYLRFNFFIFAYSKEGLLQVLVLRKSLMYYFIDVCKVFSAELSLNVLRFLFVIIALLSHLMSGACG